MAYPAITKLIQSSGTRYNFRTHEIISVYARSSSSSAATKLDTDSYAFLLQTCTHIKQVNQIQTQIIKAGLHQNAFLETKLVNAYTIFGFLEEARQVFDKIREPHRPIFSWNVMIRGYVRAGFPQESLSLYHLMQAAGIRPDKFTCPELLKACAALSSLQEGMAIHRRIASLGFASDVYVVTALIDMYAKCGRIEIARQLFDEIPERSVVTWSTMIAGYAQIGCAEEAWVLFRRMQLTGTKPDAATVVSLISGYANLADPQQGKWIHAYIIKIGFEMNVTVRTVLIDMYCRCRSMQIARTLFDKTPQRNVVSWTAIIAGYTRNGEANEALRLFHEMQLTDIKPNKITILSVLSACTNLVALQLGKDVHDYVVKNSLESDVCVGTALVAMYAKCRCVEIACELFDGLPKKDVVSWNAMLAGYAQNGHLDKAMLLFRKMLQLEDVKPNQATIVTMLPLCPHLIDLKQAKSIHAYAIRNALESDISVGNALIDMYAKFGSIEMAHMLFNKIPKKDLVSWNTMISGYSQNRLAKDAFSLFHQMQLKGVEPDQITVVTILHACAELAAWQQGKEIHGYIIIMGFESDVSVIAALVTMYKHGNIEAASQLFYSKWERDLVLWNSMIAGVSQNGFASEALTLFHQMQFEDMKPDRVTIMSILPAYADIGSLQLAKIIHMYIIKNGFETDVSVQTALITLYTKCGSVDMACHLFESMSERDVVTWNAMIASYGMHGFGKDALALFTQMQQTGVKADHVTFISILSACSHAGLLDQGKHYFNCMSPDYHIAPVLEHYTCMVDILGRAGYLDEAYEFIAKMPLEPDAGVWGALLGACGIHGNLELGEHVSEKLISLNPKNVSNYVSLSNIYAAAGRWDGVLKVRRLIKSAGIEKIPGCSWIEIKNEVHSFVVGDT